MAEEVKKVNNSGGKEADFSMSSINDSQKSLSMNKTNLEVKSLINKQMVNTLPESLVGNGNNNKLPPPKSAQIRADVPKGE